MRSKNAAVAGGGIALLLIGGAVAAIAGVPNAGMGATSSTRQTAFHGYYDGHKVTYLSTDVSSRSQAAAMHINYSAKIGKVKKSPEIYLVQGKAATGQLAIFGSEPGESNYSPLWEETDLHWKSGATPVLITSDTQIDKIEKQGKMTESSPDVILNCPIVKIGR